MMGIRSSSKDALYPPAGWQRGRSGVEVCCLSWKALQLQVADSNGRWFNESRHYLRAVLCFHL